MKSWLLFFIPLIFIILFLVLVQLHLTRLSMSKFAQQHNLTYKKLPYNIFSIGEIHGFINHAPFFIGTMSRNFEFGPMAKQNYPKEKILSMHLKVNGMPDKLIIRKRDPSKISKIIDILSVKASIPILKTGDKEFDAKVDVIGYKEEVLPWLTPQCHKAIIEFLSTDENYILRRGGVACSFSKTYISLNHLEVAFKHLITTHHKL